MKSLVVRMQTFNGLLARLASSFVLAALCSAVPFSAAFAQTATAPALLTAQSVAVLASDTVTNTGAGTLITGDVDLTPGTAVTGLLPTQVVGTINAGPTNAVAIQARADASVAYTTLKAEACPAANHHIVPFDIGGLTLVPGVYCFDSSAALTGTVTLDAQGDTAAVWVFQIGSTLITSPGSVVKLTNGAQACNVFWQVGSSATIDTTTTFIGNIFANISISIKNSATMLGRALAGVGAGGAGAVTMDTNQVAVVPCAVAVVNPPTVGKSFSPATINSGGTSTLTITMSNANTTPAAQSGSLVDTLPTGMTIANTSTTNSCASGTVGVSSGGMTVTLSGFTIPASGTCTVTVEVTATIGGLNCVAAGALVANTGSNLLAACVNLAVIPPAVPPLLGKSFNPVTSTTTTTGTSILTINLINPGTTPDVQSGSLVDTLPAGMTIANTSTSSSCTTGGTGGAVLVSLGGSTVTLSGFTIAASGSCMVTVNVTANIGSHQNCLDIGALQTNNGSNLGQVCATFIVPAPNAVTIGKAFSPATINAGGTSTLTITLTNTNLANASAPSSPLIDTLPLGLLVSGSPSTNCTGGTLSNTTSSVTLTNGVVQPGFCTVTVNVTAAAGGDFVNFLAGSSATLTVIPPVVAVPPTLAKSFNLSTINAGGTSLLTVTLSNANNTPDTLTAPLVDTFPTGVVVNGSASTTCVGGVGATATLGGSKVTLGVGAMIPSTGSCKVTVSVTAPNGGNYPNLLIAGALQTDQGVNAAPYVATLTVIPPVAIPPGVGKSFNPTSISAGGTSTLTITLTNTNGFTVPVAPSPLTDTFPSGLLIATPANASTTCIGGTVSTGTSSVTLTGGSIPASSSCKVKVNVTAPAAGSFTNLLAGARATLTVTPVYLCTLSAPVINLLGTTIGPPKQVLFSVQAAGGLKKVVVNTPPTSNVTVVVAPFVLGTTGLVNVTATKINQTQTSVVELTVTDQCGKTTVFDPVFATITIPTSKSKTTDFDFKHSKRREVTLFSGISSTEGVVLLRNSTPGVDSLVITVNHSQFRTRLSDGEIKKLDISSALVEGNNRVSVAAFGKPNSSVDLTISDGE